MCGGVGSMRRVLIALVVLAFAREARADEPSKPQSGATSGPEAAGGETASPAPAPGATKPAESQGVFLHVYSKTTVTVERDDTGEVVCTSPCDKAVPGDASYHIGGHRPSPSFTLAAPQDGKANLHVKPGSKAGFWTGVGGITLGTLLVGGGVGTLIYGLNNKETANFELEETDNSYTNVMALGTALIIGGAFVGLGGGVILANNISPEVWGNVHKSTGSTRDASPRAQPSLRATAQPGPQALPRPTYVSLFSGTF